MLVVNNIAFLNEFILAQFIIDRIEYNHTIYRQDYPMANEMVFNDRLLKFIMTILLYELKQGNTVVVIHHEFQHKIHQYLSYFYQFFALDYEPKDDLADNKDDLADKLHQAIMNDAVDLTAIDKPILLSFIKELAYYGQYFDFNDFFKETKALFEIFNQQSPESPAPFVIKKISHHGMPAFVLWLYRSYDAEWMLACRIVRLLRHSSKDMLPDGQNEGDDALNFEQNLALTSAIKYGFCMITGGPGTGKTYTLAKIVRFMIEKKLVDAQKIALVAPTGKASQRMQTSLQKLLQMPAKMGQTLDRSLDAKMVLPEAQTIHRLLGVAGAQAKFHMNNPLPYDVIVVDEASMLGVELACQLFLAVRDDAKVILLGDAHQLSAVEAGAVLADLCQVPMIKKTHVHLKKSNRFDEQSGIGQLASLIHRDAMNDCTDLKPIDIQQIQHLIKKFDTLQLLGDMPKPTMYHRLSLGFHHFFEKLISIYRCQKHDIDMADMMRLLNQYRILCSSHHGIQGVQSINQAIYQEYLAYMSAHGVSIHPVNHWYHGRVIMILKNNYNMQLFNGDIGICLMTSEGMMVFLENKLTPIAPNLLSDDMVDTAYAMTIHKSQGSEFDKVAICLDASSRRLLGRELIYTAITRAKVAVDIYANMDILQVAFNHKTMRQTGLTMIFDDLALKNGCADEMIK